MNTLGERIKWARANAGLSQTELGQKLGYGDKAKSRISNWETNISSPSVEQLAKLCFILQINPNVLVPVELDELETAAQDYVRNRKISQLNAAGRRKADDYIDDLLAVDKYTIDANSAAGRKSNADIFDNDYLYNHPAFNKPTDPDDETAQKEAHDEP